MRDDSLSVPVPNPLTMTGESPFASADFRRRNIRTCLNCRFPTDPPPASCRQEKVCTASSSKIRKPMTDSELGCTTRIRQEGTGRGRRGESPPRYDNSLQFAAVPFRRTHRPLHRLPRHDGVALDGCLLSRTEPGLVETTSNQDLRMGRPFRHIRYLQKLEHTPCPTPSSLIRSSSPRLS